jgi:hypothetical protein
VNFADSPTLGTKKESIVANPVDAPSAKLQLPVEVIGADLYGQQFFERTRTLTIHRDGVSILLVNTLAPDFEVILRNPETDEEALAFVVGQAREDTTGHVYGLAYLHPPADPWHMEFPAAHAARTVQLECKGCHSVCTLALSSIEVEIFEATRELTHSCKNCNASRTWGETSRKAIVKEPGKSPGQDPNLQSVVSPIEERRKNKRMAMKKVACIRFSGVEVVVACEDISKEGFRFTSHKEYPEGTRVEAAVPYTKSSTNIFCMSSIIYCHKMPDGQFRHGVNYTRTRGSIGWDP